VPPDGVRLIDGNAMKPGHSPPGSTSVGSGAEKTRVAYQGMIDRVRQISGVQGADITAVGHIRIVAFHQVREAWKSRYQNISAQARFDAGQNRPPVCAIAVTDVCNPAGIHIASLRQHIDAA
jgi:hypothetical protein